MLYGNTSEIKVGCVIDMHPTFVDVCVRMERKEYRFQGDLVYQMVEQVDIKV